jgi:hypothetical protein
VGGCYYTPIGKINRSEIVIVEDIDSIVVGHAYIDTYSFNQQMMMAISDRTIRKGLRAKIIHMRQLRSVCPTHGLFHRFILSVIIDLS